MGNLHLLFTLTGRVPLTAQRGRRVEDLLLKNILFDKVHTSCPAGQKKTFCIRTNTWMLFNIQSITEHYSSGFVIQTSRYSFMTWPDLQISRVTLCQAGDAVMHQNVFSVWTYKTHSVTCLFMSVCKTTHFLFFFCMSSSAELQFSDGINTFWIFNRTLSWLSWSNVSNGTGHATPHHVIGFHLWSVRYLISCMSGYKVNRSNILCSYLKFHWGSSKHCSDF